MMRRFTVLFSHASEATMGPELVAGDFPSRREATDYGFSVSRPQGVRFTVLWRDEAEPWRDHKDNPPEDVLAAGVASGFHGWL